MGVLRTDIISHSQLGGPGGSVQFDGSDDALKTADSDKYLKSIGHAFIQIQI